MATSKVTKWGNGHGLRLSRHILDLADLAVGDDVEIKVTKKQIVIKKAPRQKYDLAELVARIPKAYKRKEVDFGPPVGKEEW